MGSVDHIILMLVAGYCIGDIIVKIVSAIRDND